MKFDNIWQTECKLSDNNYLTVWYEMHIQHFSIESLALAVKNQHICKTHWAGEKISHILQRHHISQNTVANAVIQVNTWDKGEIHNISVSVVISSFECTVSPFHFMDDDSQNMYFFPFRNIFFVNASLLSIQW